MGHTTLQYTVGAAVGRMSVGTVGAISRKRNSKTTLLWGEKRGRSQGGETCIRVVYGSR